MSRFHSSNAALTRAGLHPPGDERGTGHRLRVQPGQPGCDHGAQRVAGNVVAMMAEVLHHGVPLSGQPLDGERLSGHCRLARAGELDHHVRVAGVGRQRSPHRVEGGAVHGGAVQQQQRHALTFDRVTDELSVERKRGHVAKVAAATGWPRGGRYGLSAAAKNSVMCTRRRCIWSADSASPSSSPPRNGASLK